MNDTPALRRAIVDACLRMTAIGINQGRSGNVSARIDGGHLITPSGRAYETMQPEDVARLDADDNAHGPYPPSSEWRMHARIYADRPEAGAVVHAHPPYATALACRRTGIPAFHYMVAVAGGTDIRCAGYATFGTEALADEMMRALTERRACLLANHGMIAFGRDLDDALALAWEVETLARQYWLASQGGEPVVLDESQMREVIERFRTYGAAGGERGPP